MNRIVAILLVMLLISGCSHKGSQVRRIQAAQVGKAVLYKDEIPDLTNNGVNQSDSVALYKNYINKWAKRQLLLQKAEDNLLPALKSSITKQLEETRANLVIYQYERQMVLEKLDTTLTEEEIQNYYAANGKSFVLNSNIVKALFIKLPLETPDLNKIRALARSNAHNDQQKLETLCYQFAERFDDFNEEWVAMDRISVELPQTIEDQETFLKKNSFFETRDSSSEYIVCIRDYRLRSSPSPYEYVKDDIKRVIWNARRFDFIQSLENGIFNDALKNNSLKIY